MSYYSYRRSSRDYGRWAPYVPVAARRAQAEAEVVKRAKKGQTLSPVRITGTKIATTFWGKAWCTNLEGYVDFENRLPRGRSYVRNGSVIDLQMTPQKIDAMVSGSDIYRVTVTISAFPTTKWTSICHDCAGGIDSMIELLKGRFSKGVMERICHQDQGLFPKPSEIAFSCSCPDYASMCKHVAAVLYGVGARLDTDPQLLFRLRSLDQNDLITHIDAATPLLKTGPDAARLLADDDMAALFGLDMAEDVAPVVAKGKAKPKTKPKVAAKKAIAASPKKTTRAPPVKAKPLVTAKAGRPKKAALTR